MSIVKVIDAFALCLYYMPYFLSALADINLCANVECFLASNDFPIEFDVKNI